MNTFIYALEMFRQFSKKINNYLCHVCKNLNNKTTN